MRRLSLVAALLAASCVATPAFAQRHRTPRARVDTLYGLPAGAIGLTYCEDAGDSVAVRIVIDASLLDTLPLLAETIAHEQQHAKEMRANHALCNPMPFQLLGMEVRAYCVDARLGVTMFREVAESAYLTRQDDLLTDFVTMQHTTVRGIDVREAWLKECGDLLLRVTPADGASVKP